MQIELSVSDVDTLLEFLEYSKLHIKLSVGTPRTVRRNNLTRLGKVVHKLQAAKKTIEDG